MLIAASNSWDFTACDSVPLQTRCIANRATQQTRTLPKTVTVLAGYFWGIQLFSAQNLTSYSHSATPISYKGDKILCLSRLVFEIWRGTERRGDQNRRLSQCKYASLKRQICTTDLVPSAAFWWTWSNTVVVWLSTGSATRRTSSKHNMLDSGPLAHGMSAWCHPQHVTYRNAIRKGPSNGLRDLINAKREVMLNSRLRPKSKTKLTA